MEPLTKTQKAEEKSDASNEANQVANQNKTVIERQLSRFNQNSGLLWSLSRCSQE